MCLSILTLPSASIHGMYMRRRMAYIKPNLHINELSCNSIIIYAQSKNYMKSIQEIYNYAKTCHVLARRIRGTYA